jgi:4a-hydroxytetrahydrobiopterin dehydratase
MSIEDEDRYIKEVPSWTLDREGVHRIKKSFKFKDFKDAISFVNKVAEIAEEEGHHPNISIFYNRVELELYTHAIKGLFENDFIMAAKIDEIKI